MSSNNLVLHELSAEYLQLLHHALDNNDEEMEKALDEIRGDWNNKAVSLGKVVKHVEFMVESIKKIEGDAYQRRKSLEAKIERFKKYLGYNMEATGITRIDSPYFTVALRNNPPSVNVYDEAQVPDEYMVQPETPPKKPDKKKIADDLKQGVVIEGCELVQTKRVEIK